MKETVDSVKNKLKCYNTNNNNFLCYKLFGYDILIDDKFRLYLGEINARLITFKYPPINFKKKFYTNILDLILYNKENRFTLVFESYRLSLKENFSFNISSCFYFILIVIIVLYLFKQNIHIFK